MPIPRDSVEINLASSSRPDTETRNAKLAEIQANNAEYAKNVAESAAVGGDQMLAAKRRSLSSRNEELELEVAALEHRIPHEDARLLAVELERAQLADVAERTKVDVAKAAVAEAEKALAAATFALQAVEGRASVVHGRTFSLHNAIRVHSEAYPEIYNRSDQGQPQFRKELEHA